MIKKSVLTLILPLLVLGGCACMAERNKEVDFTGMIESIESYCVEKGYSISRMTNEEDGEIILQVYADEMTMKIYLGSGPHYSIYVDKDLDAYSDEDLSVILSLLNLISYKPFTADEIRDVMENDQYTPSDFECNESNPLVHIKQFGFWENYGMEYYEYADQGISRHMNIWGRTQTENDQ